MNLDKNKTKLEWKEHQYLILKTKIEVIDIILKSIMNGGDSL